MITENGTVKVRTVIDEKIQKELSAYFRIFSLIALIIGPIGFCIVLVLYILSFFILNIDDTILLLFLVLFAADVVLGILLKVQLNRVLQNARTAPKVYEYEFFANYFTFKEFSNGEVVATAKFYNSQISKVKNAKSYFFVYITAAQAFTVSKDGLTEDELQILKTVLRLPS